MCDYSLMGVPNRLAQENEELVVHMFSTGSRGLTPDVSLTVGLFLKMLLGSLEEERVAVCVPPGTRLLLRDIPQDVQLSFGVGAEEEVQFTQLTADADEHRDAVRFQNGCEMLLQGLYNGQRIRVLQLALPEEPKSSAWPEEELLLYQGNDARGLAMHARKLH